MSDEPQFSREMLADKRFQGNLLTVLAGLFFYIVCMLLPMVGQAGVATNHYGKNAATFAAVLLVALVCAGGGLMLKLRIRKMEAGPFPYVSAILAAVYVVLLVNLVLGRLHI